ncbi:hypothetical protein CCP2SC5_210047 [Azospirillaceae bacterium]
MKEIVKRKRPKLGMSYSSDDDSVIIPAENFQDRRPDILNGVLDHCSSKTEYVDKISVLWNETQRCFIMIGRYLNYAKTQLSHGEFEPMIQRELPFGQSVANRLMAVSAAIEANIISIDVLPNSYTIAYEIISLTEQERDIAKNEGLIRQDVRREEIVAFKRRLRSSTVDKKSEIQRSLMKLINQRNKINQQIHALETELRSFDLSA